MDGFSQFCFPYAGDRRIRRRPEKVVGTNSQVVAGSAVPVLDVGVARVVGQRLGPRRGPGRTGSVAQPVVRHRECTATVAPGDLGDAIGGAAPVLGGRFGFGVAVVVVGPSVVTGGQRNRDGAVVTAVLRVRG